MKQECSIFWFRRDLRLEDNVGLAASLKGSRPVIPIFIFDPAILDKLPRQDARVDFIHDQIGRMHEQLSENVGAGISVYHGTPEDVFKSLADQYDIEAVYTNEDYEPYARERDNQIGVLLASSGIELRTFKDQVIFAKDEVVKSDGSPYVVYTPYSRKWLETYNDKPPVISESEKLLNNVLKLDNYPSVSLENLGFERSLQCIAEFNIGNEIIENYEATRNFPAIKGTSRLGPHLRFGTVSIRKMVANASAKENITFLKELIWREFFMQILWHFPHTATSSFKKKYDRIEWRNDPEEFKAWCEGKTGYPLVDAGMRELNETGFMHNRVRMLVGSFLCKHLLIDWRWGEAYFAEKLHDYEMASNVGNWQWVAGSGVDAAPYFRIFNPTTQIKKFDKDLSYIKKWVPEFEELTYPKPIVDHKMARERCLEVYKAALN